MFKSLLAFFVTLTFPTLVFGAGIVPCNPKIVNGKLVDECSFCEIGELIKNTSDWFVIVAGIFVTLVIIVAGLWMGMSVGNSSAKGWAKKTISTAIIGYIILLASWMLVDTLIKFIIPGSSFGAWNALFCV